MKNKLAVAALALAALTGSAQAGPSVGIWIGSAGGACQPVRPVCAPQPRCYQPYYYQPAVVYYNPAPVYYTTTRFSNVTGFVNGGQGVIQVSQPVLPVQPVRVYQGNGFRWR